MGVQMSTLTTLELIRDTVAKAHSSLAKIYMEDTSEVQSAVNIIIDMGYAPGVEQTINVLLEKDSTVNYSNLVSLMNATAISINSVQDTSTVVEYKSTSIKMRRLAIFFTWLINDSFRITA